MSVFPDSLALRRLSGAGRFSVILVALAASARAQNPAPQPQSPTPSAPVIPPGRTGAQDAAAAMGKKMSNAEIAAAIKSSGMSESQIRARLQQSGYDPRLVDPFFTGGSGASLNASAPASAAFINALQDIGIGGTPDILGEAEAVVDTGVTRSNPSGIFGKEVFSSKATLFDPVTAGPVDASYRLGVGDQLQLIFSGEVELLYNLDVRRDGTVFIPIVGQVSLAGLTLESARTTLRRSAARVYSGIDRGKVSVDLGIARVRSNVVYLMGEVERPGAYQVNALSTAFFALSRAGGPTVRGSFRNIEIRRGGGPKQTIDLYDYLLDGDVSKDIRLEQGDIIFVPLDTRAVAIHGAVRRSGVFELRAGEGFSDLIRFAGGFQSTAAVDRIQVDRILPPSKRTPGVERVLIDIDALQNPGVLDTIKLNDSDAITVFSIGDLRRNTVTLSGQAVAPGVFQWAPGMTVGTLIDRAQGLYPWALADRIKVDRNVVRTGRTETYSVNVLDSAGGRFELHEFDNIKVLDGRIVYPAGTVSVIGSVVTPGSRKFVERQTIGDLLDLVGGVREDASHVEIVRRRVGHDYSDTTSVSYRFEIGPNRHLSPADAAFVIERSDQIFVRASPGYRTLGTVVLQGYFTYPGVYALETEGEHVSHVIKRAGGVLPIGYKEGFRMLRDGRPVPILWDRVMSGEPDHDIELQDGDVLKIDGNPGVVNVTGAVERQVSVPYDPSWSLSDYIDAAGGASVDANMSSVVVAFASGAVERRRRFHRDPTVLAGATVTVGKKPTETGNGLSDALTKTVQITSALASLLIGYLAVKK